MKIKSYTYRFEDTECIILEASGCLYRGRAEKVMIPVGDYFAVQPLIFTDTYLSLEDAKRALNKAILDAKGVAIESR